MNATKGFLYGHYDSRGGTMFVAADTQEKADLIYATAAGWAGELANFEYKDMVDEDRLGPITLHHEGPLPEGGADLEADEGFVIAKGPNAHWPPTRDEDNDDFFDNKTTDLEYVEPGKSPVLFANGWQHPRWDDDAFNFVVATEEWAKTMAR